MISLFTKHVDFRKQFIALKFNKNSLKSLGNNGPMAVERSKLESHRIDFPNSQHPHRTSIQSTCCLGHISWLGFREIIPFYGPTIQVSEICSKIYPDICPISVHCSLVPSPAVKMCCVWCCWVAK